MEPRSQFEEVPGGNRGQSVPLSYQQETYWEAEQAHSVGYRLAGGNQSVANTFAGIRFDGAIEYAYIERAVEELLLRHDALRTRLMRENGEWIQIISPPQAVPAEYVDLTGLPGNNPESEAQGVASEAAFRPFDYTSGLLLRTVVIRLDTTQHVVVFVVPHIVSDSVSLQIVVKEFTILYLHYSSAKSSPLPDLSVHYADFVLWQRKWVNGPIRDEVAQYLGRQFAGTRSAMLPPDRISEHATSCCGAEILLQLDRPLCDLLSRLSLQWKVTPFIILVSAYGALLGRWTGQDCILINMPFAGRPDGRTFRVVGMFTNNSLLRIDLGGRPPFDELVRRTDANLSEAVRFGCIPYRILKDVARERNYSIPLSIAGTNSVPDGAKIPHGCERLLGRITGIAPYVIKVDSSVVQRQLRGDLALQFGFNHAGGVCCRFIYQPARFSHKTITTLAADFTNILKALPGTPDECRYRNVPPATLVSVSPNQSDVMLAQR